MTWKKRAMATRVREILSSEVAACRFSKDLYKSKKCRSIGNKGIAFAVFKRFHPSQKGFGVKKLRPLVQYNNKAIAKKNKE
jgi:hypothetical protein